MLKNYIKIGLRNIKRNPLHSIISVLGLAIGITGATLLYLYITNELNYDAFHGKADRIYRIVEISESGNGEIRNFGQTRPVVGTVLEETLPEIEDMIRVYRPMGHIDLQWDGDRIQERNYIMSEPGFFSVFDFKFVTGNPESALNEPNSVVLSQKKAGQLFGDENPIGKVLEFSNLAPVTVTGVIEDVPENSHLQFDILLSRLNSRIDWSNYLNNWEAYGAYTYLVLNTPVLSDQLTSRLDPFIAHQQQTNPDFPDFYLQPVTDIYFQSAGIEFGIEQEHGNMFYIFLFSWIGIFLLVIAGINYMNLATALSVSRGREIGIRKAAGAEKRQLILQFLSESVLIALAACLISWLFIEMSLPFFNDLTGKQFVLNRESAGSILMTLFGFGMVLGLLSGSYPAFYLAMLRPVNVLKSKTDLKGRSLTLHKVLIVTQFALSIVLIIATIAAFRQFEYIQTADLGFEKEQILVVDINHGDVRSRFEAMKQEMEKIPGISNVAASSRVPGDWKEITQVYARSLDTGSADSLRMYFMSFDDDVADLYNIEMARGAYFRGSRTGDSLNVILNEAAVRTLGLDDPEEARLDISGVEQPMRVIGVFKDFHYQSLHQEVAPLIVGYWANPVRAIDYFSIKMTGSDITGTIDRIKQVHAQFDPQTAMEYHFLDQQIEQKYQADIRSGRLFAIGGGVTIFITCMGLFGLASLTTQQRTKEIGIRKVMGATMADIATLVSKDFLILVVTGFVIAVPVAWYAMNQWLEDFAYRIEIGPGMFLLAGLAAVLIALVTISYQSLKAAMMNPAKSLRTE
jgi:putative ABC transport system permease protein